MLDPASSRRVGTTHDHYIHHALIDAVGSNPTSTTHLGPVVAHAHAPAVYRLYSCCLDLLSPTILANDAALQRAAMTMTGHSNDRNTHQNNHREQIHGRHPDPHENNHLGNHGNYLGLKWPSGGRVYTASRQPIDSEGYGSVLRGHSYVLFCGAFALPPRISAAMTATSTTTSSSGSGGMNMARRSGGKIGATERARSRRRLQSEDFMHAEWTYCGDAILEDDADNNDNDNENDDQASFMSDSFTSLDSTSTASSLLSDSMSYSGCPSPMMDPQELQTLSSPRSSPPSPSLNPSSPSFSSSALHRRKGLFHLRQVRDAELASWHPDLLPDTDDKFVLWIPDDSIPQLSRDEIQRQLQQFHWVPKSVNSTTPCRCQQGVQLALLQRDLFVLILERSLRRVVRRHTRLDSDSTSSESSASVSSSPCDSFPSSLNAPSSSATTTSSHLAKLAKIVTDVVEDLQMCDVETWFSPLEHEQQQQKQQIQQQQQQRQSSLFSAAPSSPILDAHGVVTVATWDDDMAVSSDDDDELSSDRNTSRLRADSGIDVGGTGGKKRPQKGMTALRSDDDGTSAVLPDQNQKHACERLEPRPRRHRHFPSGLDMQALVQDTLAIIDVA